VRLEEESFSSRLDLACEAGKLGKCLFRERFVLNESPPGSIPQIVWLHWQSYEEDDGASVRQLLDHRPERMNSVPSSRTNA